MMLTSGRCMLKNVKAAAFKPRPFILMGVNLFWNDYIHGDLGFLYALSVGASAQASSSAKGFTVGVGF